MQNFQSSDPTVSKLLEVDADLAAQEVELTLQLQSIQEKRLSLKNVISLFPPVDAATYASVAASTPVVEDVAEPPAQEVATPELDEAITDTTEAAPQSPKQQSKTNLIPTKSKPSKKAPPIKEVTEEIDTWQKYLREEFSDASLPIAVSEVMQQHPKQVLEIITILDAIFVDEIPKEVKSKARERVSNVLSVGVKKGKWYRGLAGKYSMSKAAVESNSAG